MVTTDPEGALVRDDATTVCNATPCELSLTGADAERAHSLTFRKPGFHLESRAAKPGDGPLFVHLARVPGSGSGPVVRPHGSDPASPGAAPQVPATAAPPTATPSGFKDTPY
jgi:hypothetical protein